MANRNRRSKKPMNNKSKGFRNDDRNERGKSNRLARDQQEAESPTNDVAWYAKNEQLMKASSSIVFSEPSGSKIDYVYPGQTDILQENMAAPGLLTISLIPVPGTASEKEDPVNIAAKDLYATVRQANSGSSSYDAPDLMLYTLAIAQVYSYIVWLQRLYGLSSLKYDAFNDYYPQALVYANSVDYDSLITEKANFNFMINDLIHAISKFYVPANLSYFNRLAFLFSGYYSEGESIKDQMYMYIPEGFMFFQEATNPKGGQLVYKQLYGTGTQAAGTYTGLLTPTKLYHYGMEMIQAIIACQDFKNMSGDILKAYQNNVFTLAQFPTDFAVVPTTDLVVLEQFQNADILDQVPDTVLISQDPDNNLLNIQVSIDSKTGTFTQKALLNMYSMQRHVLTTILTDPQPGDVMERTRLMMTTMSYNSDTLSYVGFQGASEIPCILRITTYGAYGASDTFKLFTATLTTKQLPGTSVNPYGLIKEHAWCETFSFHPRLFYYSMQGAAYFLYAVAVDLNNYATIDETPLRNINTAALKSLFDISSVVSVK